MVIRILLFTTCVASSLISAPIADRAGNVEKQLTPRLRIDGQPAVQWTIDDRQALHKVPAVSVAVINDGKIEWAKGYGAGISPQTQFQAASISKPVAAMTALRMVVRGELSLDEDVNKRLKSWKIPQNTWGKPVTLRQILSHTAGLTVHGFPGYAKTAPIPTLVQILNGEKPANTEAVVVDVEPGSIYRYSGGGYEVVQLLIEDVTGKPFAQVVKSLVLEPAGMKDSGYDQPLPGKAALAYNGKGEPVSGGWHVYPEQAAAGLWTTPSDLARFLLAVNASKLLPQSMTTDMLTPVKDGYALGFGIEGSGEAETFGHGGSNMGYRCTATLFRNGRQGAVVMSNGDNGDAIANELVRAVAQEYGWPSHKPVTMKVAVLSDAQLAALTGEFQDGNMKVRVTSGGKSLKVSAFGQVFEFVPKTELHFIPLTDGPPELLFDKDSDGKVTGLTAAGRKLKKL
jgi:CubicO group peptidase (beta-lactamase class C family)